MIADTYRPNTWDGFIGNPKVVAAAKAMVARASTPGPFFEKPLVVWIDGASGTGKTTLAKIMATEIGATSINVEEWDGEGFTAKRVRELEDCLQFCGFGGGWRAVIVNEAHAMTVGAVQALLTMLERLPRKRFIAFTTTEGRNDVMSGWQGFDSPLKSRCVPLSLSNQGLAQAFADRAMAIATELGLGGIDSKKAMRIVQDEKNNLRAVLSRIEAGDFVDAK